jgi:hypothetical protein
MMDEEYLSAASEDAEKRERDTWANTRKLVFPPPPPPPMRKREGEDADNRIWET